MSNVPNKFWGKNVTLRNRFTQEYLYADKYFYGIMHHERRHVFTSRSKKPVPALGDWIINTDDVGHSFTIQNVLFSEYLYAAGSRWYKINELFSFEYSKICLKNLFGKCL